MQKQYATVVLNHKKYVTLHQNNVSILQIEHNFTKIVLLLRIFLHNQNIICNFATQFVYINGHL